MIGNAIKHKTHRIRRAFGDYQCGFNDVEIVLSRGVNVKRVPFVVIFCDNATKKRRFCDFVGSCSDIHFFSLFQCIQVLYRKIDLLSIKVLFLYNKFKIDWLPDQNVDHEFHSYNLYQESCRLPILCNDHRNSFLL